MVTGSCLCGAVAFEVDHFVGPFEACHCTRCRKLSGAACLPAVGVRAADFRLLSGREQISSWDAPIVEHPPAYRSTFCSRCGSPVPDPSAHDDWFEIPAGLLDAEPNVALDKHIFVEHAVNWWRPVDDLPRYDRVGLHALRTSKD